jgi:hypothetical protein
MSAEAHIFDVGHGNCTLLTGEGFSLMVDASPSAAVVQTVVHLALVRLDAVVISHRDADGIVPLLARRELDIGAIYLPADAAKDPLAPETATLLAALHDANHAGRCSVSRDLDDAFDGNLISGPGIAVEVLAPTFASAMTGVGGKSPTGATIRTNTISAVLRVTLDGALRILLPGDLDRGGPARAARERSGSDGRCARLPPPRVSFRDQERAWVRRDPHEGGLSEHGPVLSGPRRSRASEPRHHGGCPRRGCRGCDRVHPALERLPGKRRSLA